MTWRNSMNAHQKQIEENYEAFKRKLPELMKTNVGQFALMKDKKIIEFMDTFADACKFGYKLYGLKPFSVQEVTDQPVCIY